MDLKSLLAILIGEVFVLGCVVIGIKSLFDQMTVAQQRIDEQLKALVFSVRTIEEFLEDHFADEHREEAKRSGVQLKKVIDDMPESPAKDDLQKSPFYLHLCD
ncbi:MAG: hypothetical protein ACR2JB_00590 [Bryobacteraceae bacterium]